MQAINLRKHPFGILDDKCNKRSKCFYCKRFFYKDSHGCQAHCQLCALMCGASLYALGFRSFTTSAPSRSLSR
jgi:hypothetical protein